MIDGEVFNAGDVPPEHVAVRIRNPQCWAPVTAEPGPNWTPESSPGRVPEPDPARSGLRNLEPQNPGGTSSAIPTPEPGTVTGTLPTEPSQQQPELDEQQPELAPQGTLPEPPRSGKGASTAAWRAYAEQLGVFPLPSEDRGDIIVRLQDAGHIQ